ncbi:MAG: hypothetical protein JKY94_17435 [Rhodobacteraceae bacterium]|nr:hypothetical protein [Paracoccaceae bacterium]
MFVGYGLSHVQTGKYATSGQMPRINKGALPSLEADGFRVMLRVLAIDLDLVGHTDWNKEQAENFTDALAQAGLQDPFVANWHAFYTTQHGARLIYVLDKPTPCPGAEHFIRGVLSRLCATGLRDYVDLATYDFTRLFRLPKVMRDGTKTSEHPYFSLRFQPNAPLLEVASIPPIMTTYKKYGKVVNMGKKPPSIDRAVCLLQDTTPAGTTVHSAWYKQARKMLRGREVLDFIEGTLHPEETNDGRNVTLLKVVGQAVSLLYEMSGTSPELIYAMLVEPCEQLQARTGDDDGKDWEAQAWQMVARCWDKESADVQVLNHAMEKDRLEAGEINLKILNGVREWCELDIIQGPEPEALDWLMDNCIVFSDNQYHILRQDGYFDTLGMVPLNLSARVKELGMTSLIPVNSEHMSKDGEIYYKPLQASQLINRHVFFVGAMSGVSGYQGGVIRDFGKANPVFLFQMYARRRDITPKWSDEVDAWMEATFGNDILVVRHWISHALNFEGGGICALSINAPPGIGKKLLVEGLAECITSQTVADAKELTGRFQSQILCTPFLAINEGMPKISKEGIVDPADAFRSLISGDSIPVERKGRGVIRIHNPMRIIVTANNDEVLASLYANKNLSADDRKAIGLRLLHVNLDDGGETWLRTRGGMTYTAREGERWIRGDDGKQSNWIVARHFLHLFENRQKVPKGNRLLVEGNTNSPLIQDMAIKGDTSTEVLDIVIHMLREEVCPDGMMVESGVVWISSAAVRAYHQLLMPGGKLSLSQATRTLDSVSGGPAKRKRCVDSSGQETRRRLTPLDSDLLMRHAERAGHELTRLSELFSGTDIVTPKEDG